METIKWQTRAAYGWLVICQSGRRLSLWPIGWYTPTVCDTNSAAVACGAIQVLHAFAFVGSRTDVMTTTFNNNNNNNNNNMIYIAP